ncbi:hypothetical protein NEUTE2DRAFT_64844 [Neurospora tetrasperma FGSC 2509]|nr:hypothetical protein NEUTE2DRAFT_64844 [Neurospora tetrasperma FGSC 2509]
MVQNHSSGLCRLGKPLLNREGSIYLYEAREAIVGGPIRKELFERTWQKSYQIQLETSSDTELLSTDGWLYNNPESDTHCTPSTGPGWGTDPAPISVIPTSHLHISVADRTGAEPSN